MTTTTELLQKMLHLCSNAYSSFYFHPLCFIRIKLIDLMTSYKWFKMWQFAFELMRELSCFRIYPVNPVAGICILFELLSRMKIIMLFRKDMTTLWCFYKKCFICVPMLIQLFIFMNNVSPELSYFTERHLINGLKCDSSHLNWWEKCPASKSTHRIL